MKNIKKARRELPIIILAAVVLIVMTVRVFFGIEITDEAYYVAEARTALEGNIPFAYNTNIIAGQTFVMLPFIWVYHLFVPNYEGCFLYMRLCYAAFRYMVILISVLFIRKEIGTRKTMWVMLPMSAYHLHSIQNFSYNTISAWLIFLVGIMLYYVSNNNGRSDKNKYIQYEDGILFISGFLTAIAVFSHPVHIFSTILFFVLLLLYKRNVRVLLFYCLGGLSELALAFLPIIFQAGWDNFIRGMTLFFNIKGSGGSSFLTRMTDIWNTYSHLWFVMSVVFLSVYLLLIFSKKEACFQYALTMSLISGCLYIIFRVEDYQQCSSFLGMAAFFCFVMAWIFGTDRKTPAFLSLPWVIFSFFLAFSTNSVASRFIFSVPALFGVLLVLLKEKKQMVPAFFCTAVILSVGVEFKSLLFVYRDADLPFLNTRVEEGIFKGIYTTAQMGQDTLELEQYLKSNTADDDYVSFRDNVPVGYLMMNGKACDVRTWDCMQYSHGNNDPSKLYAYYGIRELIPDKIFYVDHGRDEYLSIDTNDFKYNTFVSQYYSLEESVQLNDHYKVRKYINNGSFDGDYDKLLSSAVE